jgi:hypothetical protein
MTSARAGTRPADLAVHDLVELGAATLPSIELTSRIDPAAWAELAAAWDDLPIDRHLADGGTWRLRRFGRLRATPGTRAGYQLKPLPAAPFRQSADLIPLYEGKDRDFDPIEPVTMTSPALWSLLDHDLELIAAVEGARRPWLIQLHLIRVTTGPDLDVEPAPEGRHSDGHAYVAMHLIDKRDCTGGVSHVFQPGEAEPFLVTTMQQPLDTVVVDDRRVEHQVSPITTDAGRGHRDILLVDVDPE